MTGTSTSYYILQWFKLKAKLFPADNVILCSQFLSKFYTYFKIYHKSFFLSKITLLEVEHGRHDHSSVRVLSVSQLSPISRYGDDYFSILVSYRYLVSVLAAINSLTLPYLIPHYWHPPLQNQ